MHVALPSGHYAAGSMLCTFHGVQVIEAKQTAQEDAPLLLFAYPSFFFFFQV